MPHPPAGRGDHRMRPPARVALGGGVTVPYPTPGSPAASSVGRANPRKDTRPEVALRSALHHRGLRFRKDYPIRIDDGRPIRVDVAFTRARLAIMIDGCFWHGCPEHGTIPKSNRQYWEPKLARNVERDRANDQRLHRGGWRALRVWEHQPVEEAVRLTLDALEAARRSGDAPSR